MAHLIERKDTALFAVERAWHGLGKVWPTHPDKETAYRESGLNWEVGKDTLYRMRDGSQVKSHVETFRKFDGLPLGVVGEGYEVVQNRDLFDFAFEVASKNPDMKVESAFSMRNCRRVVVSVRADEFMPQKNDPLIMYLICANGHDGGLVFSSYFSSTRVVCNNTFKASYAAAKGTEGFVSLRHEGDMEAKMAEASTVLEAYAKTFKSYREQTAALVKHKMTKEEMDEFLTDAIMLLDGPIPTKEQAAKNARSKTKRTKSIEAFRAIADRFELEVDKLKADRNAFMAFNAATWWYQHGREGRKSKDAAKALDNKVFSDMFGQIDQAKGKLWKRALELV